MADVVKGVVSHDMDTNVLFEKFTIDEIRDIEKKTRGDIEKKKEDLRLMVGERYRDLIEAADTITEMKHSAENVMQSIGRMQELCQRMKQTHMVKGFTAPKPRLDTTKRREEVQFYGIAAQIKLLLDMPEKIWSALDCKAYLRATQMFLLARHVHTGMQMDAATHSTRMLSWFPVLARTWAAISHFRDVIYQACRDMLKLATISDTEVAECLCSLMLLEDSTPRQVFNDYLIISTTAVQELFKSDQSGMSVKEQVCAVVQMIVRTVHQIYAVFYAGGSDGTGGDDSLQVQSNLLVATLARVTDKGQAGAIIADVSSSPSMKYLPKSVTDFRPSLRNHASPIAETNLQENCQQWVSTCVQSVSSGLSQLLTYIPTVRGLAAIRGEVWTLLNQDEKMNTWDFVCGRVLRRKLVMWEEFFLQHFLQRTKMLVEAQCEGVLSACKQQIVKVLNDLATPESSSQAERDVASYVWVEGSTDMPVNMAWTTVGSKTFAEAGPLTMKAKAYTPSVQSLCRNFDGRLRALLEDMGYYVKPPSGEKIKSQDKSGTFDQYADTPVVLAFLQDSCGASCHRLVEFLSGQLDACRQQVAPEGNLRANLLILDRVLLLGRFTSALCELSQHLQQCMMGTTEKPDQSRLTRKSMGQKGRVVDHPRWNEVKDKLQKFSQESFSLWSEHLAVHLISQYQEALSDSSGRGILRASTCWDEVEIEEETEEGQTLTSTIRMPMQPSWYVTTLLYQLCEQINRVGGHALNKSVVQGLVQQLSEGLLTQYESVTTKGRTSTGSRTTGGQLPMNQTRALQLLFDVKLVSKILPRKDDTEAGKDYQKRTQKLVEILESYVDPFDLDVFTPYMNTHLSRQLQRFSVLFGCLMSVDRHSGLHSVRSTSTSHQEQHNVLPLCKDTSRLPLLPLSVQTRSSMAPPITQPPKLKSPTEQPSPPPELPMPRSESSGFLANMSTLWFSNVASKK